MRMANTRARESCRPLNFFFIVAESDYEAQEANEVVQSDDEAQEANEVVQSDDEAQEANEAVESELV